jgi:peptidylprolyl isomerase
MFDWREHLINWPQELMELKHAMKKAFLMLFIAASTAAASAQTPAKPAAPAATATHSTASTAGARLPAGIPPVKGIIKTAFSERWEDIKIGTGPDAEPNKMYKVMYMGYLAADGKKFDSSYDHPGPMLRDSGGKPILGDDGKPKYGDPQPMSFPQGYAKLIPGFDQGFAGMKIGGKRRIFIPYQLAYGEKGRVGPDPAHPVIPPRADLIFDVELVDVAEIPGPPNRNPVIMKDGKPVVQNPGAPSSPAQPGAPAPGATPPAPGTAPSAAAPAAPAATPSTTAPAEPQSK